MQSLSLFQTLPSLVVEMIIEYLQGRPRNTLDPDNKKHNQKKIVLRPLLDVRLLWRVAVLNSICDNCELSYSHRRKAIEERFPVWPAGFLYPQFGTTSLVKRVVVRARLSSDVGKIGFRAVINTPQYANMSYPSAKSLILMLSPLRNGGATGVSPLGTNNMAEFAHSLCQLTPAVTSVAIEFSSACPNTNCTQELYATLVSELTKGGVVGLSIDSKALAPWLGFTQHTGPGLTSIAIGFSVGSLAKNTLVYRNASTLKELRVGIYESGGWRCLLYGDTQTSTVCPRLTSLTMTIGENQQNVHWAGQDCVCPFPALSTLDVSGRYPFHDDLLFRGNGETLTNLSLPFCAIAANALGRMVTLEHHGVTRMNSIRIYRDTEKPRAGLANILIESQTHLMLEMTAALHFSSNTVGKWVFGAIKAAPSTAILQHLHLDGLWLGSSHILEVASGLSSLISLACLIKRSAPTVEAIPKSEHPSKLYAKFFSPNSCFKKLRVLNSARVSAVEVAIIAMQIAVVCPRFALVDFPSRLRKGFSREVSWATYNEPFKPYADSIRRLI